MPKPANSPRKSAAKGPKMGRPRTDTEPMLQRAVRFKQRQNEDINRIIEERHGEADFSAIVRELIEGGLTPHRERWAKEAKGKR